MRVNRISKYVFRTDLRKQPVGEPLACVDASELFFRPEAHTVAQCVQMLLAPHEICIGASDTRAVMLGAKVVGYIRIVDVC